MSSEFRILGPLGAIVDGRSVELGAPKPRALLAILLLSANEVVTVSRLIDELWGDDPPAAAVNLVQGYVSDLRKVLGKEAIATRGGGYLLRVEQDELDLHRFERLVASGRRSFEHESPEEAAERLRQALGIWQGEALADLAGEAFSRAPAARLEELRLGAIELRVQADLAGGRQAAVVPELQELVARNPLRERLRELLMLALYRAGRQADALEAYRAGRALLVAELGIEPCPALQELERAILRQDPSLLARQASPAQRSILVAAGSALSVAEDLVRVPARELIYVQVCEPAELAAAATEAEERRQALLARGVAARATALASRVPADDLVRLASDQDVDLVLVAGDLDDPLVRVLLDEAPCDVAVLAGSGDAGGPVVVLFGGGTNDWAALELSGWLARAREVPLRIAGPGEEASRLLASASLAVQRTLGIAAEPFLLPPGEATAGAGVVVVGLPEGWRQRGLGPVRTGAVTPAQIALLVRAGLRPGGLAPLESLTRYTWSLAPGSV